MASSTKSYAQEEILISCDLCGTSESASCYCKECLVHICDSCKNPHLRHTIVPVLEGLLERLHSNCSKHRQRYTYYCKKCDVNICERCLDFFHRGHEFENVGTRGKQLKDNFSEKIKSKKSVATKIRDFMNRITRHEQVFKDRSKIQIEKVWSEIKEKKEILDKEGGKITEVLNLEQKEALKKFKNQRKELQDLYIKLTNLTESLENQLSNLPGEAVLNFVHENETKLDVNPTNLRYELPKPSEFTAGVKLFGSLSRVPPEPLDIVLEPPSLRRELEVVGKFKPTGSAVLCISPTDDDMFWVGTLDSKLLLVNNEGRTIRQVDLPGVSCYTATTGPGDALVSTLHHVIYKVTRQGRVIEFIDVSPDTVHGVTSTQQGDVFACVESDSGWKVKKFSEEGNFVLELDSAMFKPRNTLCCIHAVRGNVVCIQDGYSRRDAECQLVFVTSFGQVEQRVTRTGKLCDDTSTIVWDEHGNMLTGTTNDDYIHVFSGEGEFKRSFKLESSWRIWALCLGKDGVMWIGTGEREIIRAKYLQ